MREYNVFISHSWSYSDNYEKLISIMRNVPYFEFNDFSVPKDDPLRIYNNNNYESELYNKLLNKIKMCNAIIVLAGVYSSYSDSIQTEVRIAKSLSKPIIAVQPWGAEKTSQFVKDNATVIVGWNGQSIAEAVKQYGC